MDATTDGGAGRLGHPPSTESSPDCQFCRSLRPGSEPDGLLVYQDEHLHAVHPVAHGGRSELGVVRLQTRRHVPDLASLTDSEAGGLGLAIARISRALMECTGAAWTYCFGFTEGVRHVHLVIASRYRELPSEYLRLRHADWPDAPRGGRDEVAELAQRLRTSVSRSSSTGEPF